MNDYAAAPQPDAGYFLHNVNRDFDSRVSLTPMQYGDARRAFKRLRQVAAIEEKFNVVIDNFVELERERFQIALAYRLNRHLAAGRQIDLASAINRRYLNLLASDYLYGRTFAEHLSALLSPDDVAAARNRWQTFVASDESSRVLSIIRNHLQHTNLSLSYLPVTPGIGDAVVDRFTIEPSVRLDDLARHKRRFDNETIEQMRERAGNDPHYRLDIDTRRHLWLLKLFHEELRDKCQQTVEAVEEHMRVFVAMYRAQNHYENNASELIVGQKTATGTMIGMQRLPVRTIDRIHHLQTANQPSISLETSFVSNEPIPFPEPE